MLQPGQRLDDYRIESLFASGGMGEIYLADEVSLNRQVAIKVIRPEAIRYPDSEDAQKVTKLFRREATAIARLNHPYVLPLYRFGEATLDGIPLMYMVMPYCQEKSLTDWMQTRGKTILSPQEVDYILRQAAEALQYAHDQGVIHLDVKPSNFLVRYRADDASKLNLQLADFGVAKLTATTGMSQTVRGSLEYMAPEQWEGSPVFATDQYALAAMIYKFLTGQAPFKGTRFEQLWHQHRYMQPQPPSTINPNIPPSIDNVLLRAMAKNPSERFPSVMAFAEAYHQALQAPVPKTERAEIPKTEYAPFYQTLMISPEEASRGTYRTITLPSGEQLPVSVPPGAYSGQVINIPRQNGPSVFVSLQVPTMQTPPPPPPPLPTPRPGSSPSPGPNRNMRYVLAGLALLLIIGGIIVGVSVNNSNQNNAQATATAQANQQAQATIDAQSTIDAQATQNAQATQSAQPTIANVQGSYSGTYQDSTSSTTNPMSLTIAQQNQQSWTGSCTLQGTSGSSNFNITDGTVDQNGNITFSISAVDGNGNNVTVSFTSTQPNSPTGWTGNYSISNGASGSWNVS